MRYSTIIHVIVLGVLIAKNAAAQNDATNRQKRQADTLTGTTDTVTVTAFSLQGRWQDAPAAVAVLSEKRLTLQSPVSLVPALNTVAGVRMEERSPGSYRLSIRGSLLRSPYGVRNVKMYWNDIPLTDAGGNTYLNLADISGLQSVEIIKGPASSMYGANTGGAVILHSGAYIPKHHASVSVTGGSYGLMKETAKWTFANDRFSSGLQQSHLQADGYRTHSAMRRDVLKWDGQWQLSARQQLSYLVLYSDLYYQTPGGLTLGQLYSDTTAYPRAVQQRNAIYNKTLLAGITLRSAIGQHFDNVTTLTGNHTAFKNPFTTNYEVRDEWNYGGRSVFTYHLRNEALQVAWLAGAEWLFNQSQIDNYDNNAGVKGDVQFKDNLRATQSSVFTQVNAGIGQHLLLQAGISGNQQHISYQRPADSIASNKQTNNPRYLAAPRISALYKLTKGVNIYTVAARGFSTPTLAEFHPSNGSFNQGLQAEYGWNFEAGVKGSLLRNRLLYDVSAYSFSLRNAIVRRSSEAVPEYYVNAGKTRQQGVEAWFKSYVISNPAAFVSSLSVSHSFAYQPYRFVSYSIDQTDYSGNPITGVPELVNVTTVEMGSNNGFYINVILNNTSSLSLNDAATAFAKRYHLLQGKAGWQGNYHHLAVHVFAGADNLFNETYSLGNDINAFGKRYYNPAPKRNYYAGLEISL